MFYFYVFSAQRILQRTPASKNDQLCMTLNMYICAFVYSIGALISCSLPIDLQRKSKCPLSLTCNAMIMTHR